VDHIVTSIQNSCPITPAVSKVSAGACEFKEIYSVRYLSEFLQDAASQGFTIIPLAIPDNSSNLEYVPLNKVKFNPKENVIIVLGNEGDGISNEVIRSASYFTYIAPHLSDTMVGKYPFNIIDSLNVGACASIVLYHMKQAMEQVRQEEKKKE
jgi:21S rRNA (GM2251-2'-O)-methyltransferase